jgi:hypothetical protein
MPHTFIRPPPIAEAWQELQPSDAGPCQEPGAARAGGTARGCAWRPASSGNVSKMPYVDGPSLIAYQALVAGSPRTRARPPRRNSSTVDFTGLCFHRTSSAT